MEKVKAEEGRFGLTPSFKFAVTTLWLELNACQCRERMERRQSDIYHWDNLHGVLE